jgi:hypothetical protein
MKHHCTCRYSGECKACNLPRKILKRRSLFRYLEDYPPPRDATKVSLTTTQELQIIKEYGHGL